MKEKRAVRSRMKKQVRVLQALYIFSTLCSVVAVGLLVWVGVHAFTSLDSSGTEVSSGNNDAIEEKVPCDFVRKLDGVCVDSKQEVNTLLTAVMIENHANSRPQSGLAEASIVYEAPVEGQISRFLAIYPAYPEAIDKVGPVRSARPYYLDWVREYGEPLYMHVGGSPQALSLIKQYGIYDRDEMRYGSRNFWRSGDRAAPHNVYTSSELWGKAHDERDWETIPTYDSWEFDERESCFAEEGAGDTICVEEVTVSFSPPTYEAVWKYNKETAQFERYQMGKLHKDKAGEKIVADTVVVQRVETVVLDNEGRLGMTTVGEGEVTVFRDGYRFDGMWKKDSDTVRTEFATKDGVTIPLRSGKIWVEVVNQHGAVEVGEEGGGAE